MHSWVYLVLALAIGLPLLAAAALADRRSRIARHAQLTSAPERPIPGFSGATPDYVPADDVLGRAISLRHNDEEENRRIGILLSECVQISAGWASDRFATHADPVRTLLDDPAVLIADEIGTMREMLTPLQNARRLGAPLVIVAGKIEQATLDTLAANRIRFGLGVLVVLADEATRQRIAEITGSARTTRIDLQAGYLRAESLRRVTFWSANATTSWIGKPQPSSQT
ncbi:MAG: hypothetical protein Q3997_07185 [Propionibacteriaceae bacterium]|nr:hypothetical protein [Propionibacteriaceae bacterium]